MSTEDHVKLLFDVKDTYRRELMKEMNVTEKYVDDSVNMIMNWYKKQPHFPKYALDFTYIKSIFSFSKFSVEVTKQAIDVLLSAGNYLPEYFANRDPMSDSIVRVNKFVQLSIIPKLTPEGDRIVIYKVCAQNPELYTPEEGIKFGFMALDLRYFLDCASGEISIFDYKHGTFGHAVKYKPMILKGTAFLLQNAFKLRLKGIHFINLPAYTQKLLHMWKTFMKNKMKERIHVHETADELYKFVPREYLTTDLGGPYNGDELAANLDKIMELPIWRNWFITSSKENTDESKRPNKTNVFDDFQGLQGSFRSLDID